MFARLERFDIFRIFRGLIVLVFFVVLGVYLAENQLNNLTQRQNCVKSFNIKRDQQGEYSVYILGDNYNFKAAYSPGVIINTGREIVVRPAGELYNNAVITMPTVLTINIEKFYSWLEKWYKQLSLEVAEIRRAVEGYMELVWPYIKGIYAYIVYLLNIALEYISYLVNRAIEYMKEI